MDEGIKDITIEPADIKREYSKLHMQTFNNLQEIEHLLRKFHDVLQKNPKELSVRLFFLFSVSLISGLIFLFPILLLILPFLGH